MNTIEQTPAKADAPKQPKYFHFSQNNSRGGFVIDETVAHHVIIQAYTAEEANRLAINVGIYFNGCDIGMDCGCCGDRWHQAYGEGDETPLIYSESPEGYHDMFTKRGEPVCHVYHRDGSKTTYRRPTE